nr:transcriptional regulator CRZ1-like [Dermatophagoides farinae]
MDFQSEFTNNDPNGYQTIGRQVEIDSNDNQRLIIEELFESTMNAMETVPNVRRTKNQCLQTSSSSSISATINQAPTKRRSERLSTKRSNDVVVNAAIDDNQESDLSGSTTDDDEDEDEYTAPKNRKKATTKQSSSSLSCPKCSFKFESEAILNSHLKTHVPGREQICELCGNLFTRKSDLDRHNRTVHSDVKRLFKCQFCNYACSLELSLQKTYTYTFKRSFVWL